MTTIDKAREEQDPQIEESTKKPAWKDLPEMDERLREILQEDATPSRTGIAHEAIMSKIKGLETLKRGVHSVDLEKTVNDMFMVMKNMEAQLEEVLSINSVLEKDLNEAKEMIADLKEGKSRLEETVSGMEAEAPPKRELQIEIDQLIEERNSVQGSVHEMNSKVRKLQDAVMEHQRRSGNLGEEKKDLMAEIGFLESRLNTAAEKITLCQSEINVLKGEKLAQVEKVKVLEEELNEALEDKYKLISELKASKKAVAELHSAFSDKKLQAKKSFYKSAVKKTK